MIPDFSGIGIVMGGLLIFCIVLILLVVWMATR